LAFVTEDITSRFAESLGAPITPCGCSLRTGTVRKSIRGLFSEIEKDYPHLKETLLSAMGHLEPDRLLDPRYLDLEGQKPAPEQAPLTILAELSRSKVRKSWYADCNRYRNVRRRARAKKSKTRTARVGIIGLGYVGLPLAVRIRQSRLFRHTESTFRNPR